ncbi:MAG: hypothetical protein SGCHY_001339 [Lobulomycetales sp.]
MAGSSKSSKRSSMTALMTKAIRHSWTASVRLPQTDGRPSEGFSDDGVRSRIYSLHPVVPSTTTSPPLFLTELPLPLVQFVPAPLFRSHVLELNRILSSAHASRAASYIYFRVAYVCCALSIALSALATLIFGHVVPGVVLLSSLALLALLWPLVTHVWFTSMLGKVGGSIQTAVTEWNNRAPRGVRFRVITTGDFFQPDQEFGLDEYSADLEFQVILDRALYAEDDIEEEQNDDMEAALFGYDDDTARLVQSPDHLRDIEQGITLEGDLSSRLIG